MTDLTVFPASQVSLQLMQKCGIIVNRIINTCLKCEMLNYCLCKVNTKNGFMWSQIRANFYLIFDS
jgi:hypothetical protein